MKREHLGRQHFLIAAILSAAARCVSAMYEENTDTNEGTCSQADIDVVVGQLMKECSKAQVENLACVVDRALAKWGSDFHSKPGVGNGVLRIIKNLDDLPADHEPSTEDLWEAIRRIEEICK